MNTHNNIGSPFESSPATSSASSTPKRAKPYSAGKKGRSIAGGQVTEDVLRSSFGSGTPRDKITTLVNECKLIARGYAIQCTKSIPELPGLHRNLESTVGSLMHRNQTLRYNEVSVFDKAMVHLFGEDKLAALILFVAEYTGVVDGANSTERCNDAKQKLKQHGVIREAPANISGRRSRNGTGALAASNSAYSGQANLPRLPRTPSRNRAASAFAAQNGSVSPGPAASNQPVISAKNGVGAVVQDAASHSAFPDLNMLGAMGPIASSQPAFQAQNRFNGTSQGTFNLSDGLESGGFSGFTPGSFDPHADGSAAHRPIDDMTYMPNPSSPDSGHSGGNPFAQKLHDLDYTPNDGTIDPCLFQYDSAYQVTAGMNRPFAGDDSSPQKGPD